MERVEAAAASGEVVTEDQPALKESEGLEATKRVEAAVTGLAREGSGTRLVAEETAARAAAMATMAPEDGQPAPKAEEEGPDKLLARLQRVKDARAVEFEARDILTRHGIPWDATVNLYIVTVPDDEKKAMIFVMLEDGSTCPKWTMGENVYTHMGLKMVDPFVTSHHTIVRVMSTLKIVPGWEVDLVTNQLTSVQRSLAASRVNALMRIRGATPETAITCVVARGRILMISEKARNGALVECNELLKDGKTYAEANIVPAQEAKELVAAWAKKHVRCAQSSTIFAHTATIDDYWCDACAIQGSNDESLLFFRIQETFPNQKGLAKRLRSLSPSSRSSSPSTRIQTESSSSRSESPSPLPPRASKFASLTEKRAREQMVEEQMQEEKRLARKRKAVEIEKKRKEEERKEKKEVQANKKRLEEESQATIRPEEQKSEKAKTERAEQGPKMQQEQESLEKAKLEKQKLDKAKLEEERAATERQHLQRLEVERAQATAERARERRETDAKLKQLHDAFEAVQLQMKKELEVKDAQLKYQEAILEKHPPAWFKDPEGCSKKTKISPELQPLDSNLQQQHEGFGVVPPSLMPQPSMTPPALIPPSMLYPLPSLPVAFASPMQPIGRNYQAPPMQPIGRNYQAPYVDPDVFLLQKRAMEYDLELKRVERDRVHRLREESDDIRTRLQSVQEQALLRQLYWRGGGLCFLMCFSLSLHLWPCLSPSLMRSPIQPSDVL